MLCTRQNMVTTPLEAYIKYMVKTKHVPNMIYHNPSASESMAPFDSESLNWVPNLRSFQKPSQSSFLLASSAPTPSNMFWRASCRASSFFVPSFLALDCHRLACPPYHHAASYWCHRFPRQLALFSLLASGRAWVYCHHL